MSSNAKRLAVIDDDARIRAILQATEVEALYIKRPIMVAHLTSLWLCYVAEGEADWQKWYQGLLKVELPKEFNR